MIGVLEAEDVARDLDNRVLKPASSGPDASTSTVEIQSNSTPA
jgi:hypothetical protein